MIEKMKFLSITGPKADIDRVVDTYLSRYEIHLENALSELKTVKDLRPYIETNPYKEKLNLARELAEKIGGQLQSVPEKELPSQEEAAKTVDDISSRLKELNDKKEELQAQIQTLKRSKDQVEPFTELNYSVSSSVLAGFPGNTLTSLIARCMRPLTRSCLSVWKMRNMYGSFILCRRSWQIRSMLFMRLCILNAVSCQMSTKALLWKQSMC